MLYELLYIYVFKDFLKKNQRANDLILLSFI